MSNAAREFGDKQRDGSAQAGGLQLVSVITQARPSTLALALFATKSLVISASFATVGGLAGVIIFAPTFGPVLPFLIGSWTGFTIGVVQRYRIDGDEAIDASKKYPALMQLHVDQLLVNARKGQPFDEWRTSLETNHFKRGLAILGLYGASDAIDKIRQQREAALVDAYAQRQATGDHDAAPKTGEVTSQLA